MSNAAIAGSGAAAAAAAMAQAIKASGAIVRVEPPDFQTILSKTERRIFARVTHQYLTGYKGLVFCTKSKVFLPLPSRAEIIAAKKNWLPS